MSEFRIVSIISVKCALFRSFFLTKLHSQSACIHAAYWNALVETYTTHSILFLKRRRSGCYDCECGSFPISDPRLGTEATSSVAARREKGKPALPGKKKSEGNYENTAEGRNGGGWDRRMDTELTLGPTPSTNTNGLSGV